MSQVDRPPAWQPWAGAALVVGWGALIWAYRGRLAADFWPPDSSRVGPNLVASAMLATGTLVLAALIYPPARRALHRFVDRKLVAMRRETAQHEAWVARHVAAIHRAATGYDVEPHPHGHDLGTNPSRRNDMAGTDSYTVKRRHIPWSPYSDAEPRPLGRHVHHDSRSLGYKVEADGTVVTKQWNRAIPVLDQGQVGSCTGNAATGNAGTEPVYNGLAAQIAAGQLHLDEAEALTLYSAAERIDGGAGYPPEDNGSSGLSVAKAAQAAGLCSGYVHITSVEAAQTAIQNGPFMIGSNWYDGFDNPDANGLVTISGSVRGGHEYECVGYDATTDLWHCINSWGTGYGVGGHFWFSSATFARLLAEEGDATQLVPISQPAPTPTPAPTPPAPIPTPPAPPAPTPDPGNIAQQMIAEVEKVAAAAVARIEKIVSRITLPAAPTPGPIPPLPTWTDPGSVSLFLTALLTNIIGIWTLAAPWDPRWSATAQAAIPIASFLIAGIATAVNVYLHRKATMAAREQAAAAGIHARYADAIEASGRAVRA